MQVSQCVQCGLAVLAELLHRLVVLQLFVRHLLQAVAHAVQRRAHANDGGHGALGGGFPGLGAVGSVLFHRSLVSVLPARKVAVAVELGQHVLPVGHQLLLLFQVGDFAVVGIQLGLIQLVDELLLFGLCLQILLVGRLGLLACLAELVLDGDVVLLGGQQDLRLVLDLPVDVVDLLVGLLGHLGAVLIQGAPKLVFVLRGLGIGLVPLLNDLQDAVLLASLKLRKGLLFAQQGAVSVLGLAVVRAHLGQQGVVLLFRNGHPLGLELDLPCQALGLFGDELFHRGRVAARHFPQRIFAGGVGHLGLVGLQLVGECACQRVRQCLAAFGCFGFCGISSRSIQCLVHGVLVVVGQRAKGVQLAPGAFHGVPDLLHGGGGLAAGLLDAAVGGDQHIVLRCLLCCILCALQSILINGIAQVERIHLHGVVQPNHAVLYGNGRLIQSGGHTVFYRKGRIVSAVPQLVLFRLVANAQDRTLKDVLRIAGCNVAGRMDAPEGGEDVPDGSGSAMHGSLCLRQNALILQAFHHAQHDIFAVLSHHLGRRCNAEEQFECFNDLSAQRFDAVDRHANRSVVVKDLAEPVKNAQCRVLHGISDAAEQFAPCFRNAKEAQAVFCQLPTCRNDGTNQRVKCFHNGASAVLDHLAEHHYHGSQCFLNVRCSIDDGLTDRSCKHGKHAHRRSRQRDHTQRLCKVPECFCQQLQSNRQLRHCRQEGTTQHSDQHSVQKHL